MPVPLRRVRPLLALVAALQAGAAMAAVTELGWDAQDRFEHHATVAPGRFVELCGPLRRAEAVAWRFEAEAPLDFNIHYHEGRAVHYPERQGAVANAQGRLQPALDQDYCWMWTNKSAGPVRLSVQLQRSR